MKTELKLPLIISARPYQESEQEYKSVLPQVSSPGAYVAQTNKFNRVQTIFLHQNRKQLGWHNDTTLRGFEIGHRGLQREAS